MKAYIRVFSNHPDTLNEMLALRQQGWSLESLAEKYQVSSHRAIQYHCIRNGLPTKIDLRPDYYQQYKLGFQSRHAFPPSVFPIDTILDFIAMHYLHEEKMNPGKNYRDYIRDQDMRRRQRLLVGTPVVKPVTT
jgi:hypothetical protein